MVTYYGVMGVLKNGRKLGEILKERVVVDEDKVLVGIVKYTDWAIAPDLTLKSVYESFYDDLYEEGSWSGIDLYEVSRGNIGDCSDEGRVSLEQIEKFLK